MNLAQDLKEEAAERMQLIGLSLDVVDLLLEKDIIRQSKPHTYACEALSPEQIERIKEFEISRHVLVYFVVRSFTSIGTMDAFLYVSNCPDDWELERKQLTEKTCMAYVYNYDKPDYSGVSSIKFELTDNGGLRRA